MFAKERSKNYILYETKTFNGAVRISIQGYIA